MNVKKKGVMCSTLSSSSSSSSYKDPNTALKLLPLTILALASALPAQDQEVIAYMITRSITTPTNVPSSQKNKCKKKPSQKLPLFDCGCFDCYTSFWYRWDSSPNRDLIHQVIEAFEDHLVHKDSPKKHNNKGKRKHNKLVIDRFGSKISYIVPEKELQSTEISKPETEINRYAEENGDECEDKVAGELTRNLEMKVVTVQVLQAPVSSRKGLARKVLPDVVGLLNSRLWNLWGPSI